MNLVTIIVCTYNRGAILVECLRSLSAQTDSDFELLLVDNASTDDTYELAEAELEGLPNARLVRCKDIGLSHARNYGMEAASGDWIGYLDDDAIVEADFVSRVKSGIKMGLYDAFGGVYYPWYRYGRPVWFSDMYGGNFHAFQCDDHRTLSENEYFSGGIAFYRKEPLMKSGGFPIEFGMHGDKIGYGEENVVQDALRAAGASIGIVSNVEMKHLVAPYKLSLSWHLKSQFESGRAHTRQHGRDKLLKALFLLFIGPLARLRKMRVSHYKGLRGCAFGAVVTVLRGGAYYLGRISK